SDENEQTIGTDPNSVDTDNDGFSDSEEIAQKTIPTDPNSNLIKRGQNLLSADQLKNADVDGDGQITARDVSALNNMVINFLDLNQDQSINGTDLSRMEELIRFANLGVSFHDIALADLNNDGYVNEKDKELLTQAIAHYKDVNGDHVINDQDIQAVRTIQELNLNINDVKTADLNGDGLINKEDFDLYDTIIKFMKDMNGDLDADGDGIADVNEQRMDYDKDGIDDRVEYALWGSMRINDINFDQDADGMPDAAEYLLFGNMTTLLTAADKADTNQNGVSDQVELAIYGQYKLEMVSLMYDGDQNGVPDIIEKIQEVYFAGNMTDIDQDGSLNWEDADSDNDGFSDGCEIGHNTNPFDANSRPYQPTIEDTDGDGMLDLNEKSLTMLREALLALSAVEPALRDEIEGIEFEAGVGDAEKKAHFIGDVITKLATLPKTSALVSVLLGKPIDLSQYATRSALEGKLLQMFASDQAITGLIAGIDQNFDKDAFVNALVNGLILNGISEGLYNRHDIDIDGDGFVDWKDTDSDNDGYSDKEEIDQGTNPYDRQSKPILGGLDYVDVQTLDDVIQYLSISQFATYLDAADIDGLGLDERDLEILNNVIANMVDVTGDGSVTWADVERIKDAIGDDKALTGQYITVDEANRADTNGVNGVDPADILLLNAVHEYLEKGKLITNNETIGADDLYWDATSHSLKHYSPGQTKFEVADEIDIMRAILYYRELWDTLGLDDADLAIANINNSDDGIVDGQDVTLFDNAYKLLYQLCTVKNSTTGQNMQVLRGDFTGPNNVPDGKITAEDLALMRSFSTHMGTTTLSGTTWPELLSRVRAADLNHDEKITAADMDILKLIQDNLHDVDGNGAIGDDEYTFDQTTGRLVMNAVNSTADDIDFIRLKMANQQTMNAYGVSDPPAHLPDIASFDPDTNTGKY
ncbi:MAG: hypothetical protein PHT32_08885, partial [Candidatus Omnitrophica bacterium]|nr:hypothetical protein [Candidatus Omnitrophota bacterium]